MGYLTARQFAKRLRVSPEAIYLRLKAGDIKSTIHAGKQWYIAESELLHWVRKDGKKSRNLERIKKIV